MQFLLIRQWIDAILIMMTDDNNEIDDVLNKNEIIVAVPGIYN